MKTWVHEHHVSPYSSHIYGPPLVGWRQGQLPQLFGSAVVGLLTAKSHKLPLIRNIWNYILKFANKYVVNVSHVTIPNLNTHVVCVIYCCKQYAPWDVTLYHLISYAANCYHINHLATFTAVGTTTDYPQWYTTHQRHWSYFPVVWSANCSSNCTGSGNIIQVENSE